MGPVITKELTRIMKEEGFERDGENTTFFKIVRFADETFRTRIEIRHRVASTTSVGQLHTRAYWIVVVKMPEHENAVSPKSDSAYGALELAKFAERIAMGVA